MIVGDSGAAVNFIVVEDVVLNLDAIDDAGKMEGDAVFFQDFQKSLYKLEPRRASRS